MHTNNLHSWTPIKPNQSKTTYLHCKAVVKADLARGKMVNTLAD